MHIFKLLFYIQPSRNLKNNDTVIFDNAEGGRWVK